MNAIIARPNEVIQIGRLGENIYTLVKFDISEYLAQYPTATAILLNMRPGDTTAYPVANTTTDEQYLNWTVADNDLTVKGMGYCELVIMDGEMVAKSIIYPTQIMDALDGSGEEPADWDTWLSQFESLAAQANSSAIEAAGSATLSESWAVGGTGTRPGEDTDNAKHYAELAQQGAQEAGYAFFDIDDATGLMMVTITENLADYVTFSINEQSGELEVTVI